MTPYGCLKFQHTHTGPQRKLSKLILEPVFQPHSWLGDGALLDTFSSESLREIPHSTLEVTPSAYQLGRCHVVIKRLCPTDS
jgi:hypothetical protein